ncbi:MAG: 4Fe-4S dicluster domain-containing protein [Firmicutes bacterium]|nr:4Fe-4S dicluster domain-containing protein [Bacillota bacterium]
MQYREFGNTGVKISALGFGAMRLPEIEENGAYRIDEEKALAVITRAFELGVNYIDTAYGYCHGNSEVVVGKALKGWRDKVYVSTKMPTWLVKAKGDYRRLLEEQLQKLDVDYIDFYHFHALNQERWENIVLKYDLLDEARRAKEEGLIRHISFSFHDKPEVLKQLADVGIFSSLLCQYNLLDRANEEAIGYARSKGLGIVIMGPVAGGRLAASSKTIQQLLEGRSVSTPELALRFVLANQNVSCALSGMNTVEMVEENADAASLDTPLTEAELQRIKEAMEENQHLAELYCTGCDYCMPCPQGVNIPLNFRLMNYHRVYGLTEYARGQYQKIGTTEELKGKKAEECIECGICEDKCPQNIEIRKQLKETAAALG